MLKIERQYKGKRVVLCNDCGLIYWGTYGVDDRWIVKLPLIKAEKMLKAPSMTGCEIIKE